MPLVINALGCKHTHTNAQTKAISRKQVCFGYSSCDIPGLKCIINCFAGLKIHICILKIVSLIANLFYRVNGQIDLFLDTIYSRHTEIFKLLSTVVLNSRNLQGNLWLP